MPSSWEGDKTEVTAGREAILSLFLPRLPAALPPPLPLPHPHPVPPHLSTAKTASTFTVTTAPTQQQPGTVHTAPHVPCWDMESQATCPGWPGMASPGLLCHWTPALLHGIYGSASFHQICSLVNAHSLRGAWTLHLHSSLEPRFH